MFVKAENSELLAAVATTKTSSPVFRRDPFQNSLELLGTPAICSLKLLLGTPAICSLKFLIFATITGVEIISALTSFLSLRMCTRSGDAILNGKS